MRKRDNETFILDNIDSITPEPIKKPTWFQKKVYRIKRFVRLIKVAFHKPYMLKAVLTARCPHCKRLTFPIIREQGTMYQDEYDNYFCGCKDCREINDSYWESIWEEYYSRLL